MKKETRRFSTNVLKKLKEKKHKEMTIEQEATKQKTPPEEEKHQERREKKIIPRMQNRVMKKSILTRKRTVLRTPERGRK